MGPTKIRRPASSATIYAVLVPPHREKVGEGKEKEVERGRRREGGMGWRDSDSITVESVLDQSQLRSSMLLAQAGNAASPVKYKEVVPLTPQVL